MFYKDVYQLTFIILSIYILQSTCLSTEKSIVPGYGKPPGYIGYNPVWTFKCFNNTCKKIPLKTISPATTISKKDDGKGNEKPELMSLNVCKLFCGKNTGVLWPLPTGNIVIKGPAVPIRSDNIEINSVAETTKEFTVETATIFKKLADDFKNSLLKKLPKEGEVRDFHTTLTILAILKDPEHTSLKLETDESYSINLFYDDSTKGVMTHVKADTYFGVRHALETLKQLIVYDEVKGNMVIPQKITITDKPAYPYRGLTLDTSRNFISLNSLKRTLDGMAANKLNMFHWHITDTHSFPFEPPSMPEFARYGAYSRDKIYRASDIREIVEYAKVKGVKVIPEFDAPAHVGEGWQWTYPEMVVCFNKQPWNQYCVEPPCGQLNPTIDMLYSRVLNDLYQDIFDVFDVDTLFHMGGDEVHFQCWNETTDITEWMTKRGWKTNDEGFLQLWNYFQQHALELVMRAAGSKKPNIILWTSKLTTGEALKKYLDKRQYIIQIWTKGNDPNVAELLNNGYRVIFSNYEALYFDCGFGGWVTDGNNWCSPYIPWQTVYMNKPEELAREALLSNFTLATTKQILGQSAALWTEQADDHSIDNRFWPRASALAERTWTNPKTNWADAEYRFLHQRDNLVELGISADSLQPQWCYQHEGDCPIE
ncbi:beta-hexosaminidase 1 [Lycorma delicatula]|uniref:beta-hexosaminidase 1 n=1 Tax=Lycorma delicatula TaxID=130591 RepID=UPI003F511450